MIASALPRYDAAPDIVRCTVTPVDLESSLILAGEFERSASSSTPALESVEQRQCGAFG
jgi:hypothetical protein